MFIFIVQSLFIHTTYSLGDIFTRQIDILVYLTKNKIYYSKFIINLKIIIIIFKIYQYQITYNCFKV